MCVKAGAGCGKSVLLRSLADTVFANAARRTTCCFFFGEGGNNSNTLQRSALECVKVLLRQLLYRAPDLIDQVMLPLYELEPENLATQFTLLWDALLSCAKTYQGQVICIIDGLDQCGREMPTGSHMPFATLGQLLKKLNDFTEQSDSGNLKLLISVRENSGDDLEDFLSRVTSWCDLSADKKLVDADLEIYLKDKMKSLHMKPEVGPSVQNRLLKLQTESRTYLWLDLIFELLQKPLHCNRDAKHYRDLLKEMPTNVEGMFERLLPQVDENVETVKLIFHIILVARRPLKVSELSVALEFAADSEKAQKNLDAQDEFDFEKTLASLCGPFLDITTVSTIENRDADRRDEVATKTYKIVTFCHQKACEYLLRHKGMLPPEQGTFKHAFAQKDSEYIMLKACVGFLEYCGAPQRGVERNIATLRGREQITKWLDKYIDDHPFMGYAALNWLFHMPFRNTAAVVPTTDLIKNISDVSKSTFHTWFLCCWRLWHSESSLTVFFPIVLLGFTPDHFYPDEFLVNEFEWQDKLDTSKPRWWLWQASAGVETWKRLLEKCEDPFDGLTLRRISTSYMVRPGFKVVGTGDVIDMINAEGEPSHRSRARRRVPADRDFMLQTSAFTTTAASSGSSSSSPSPASRTPATTPSQDLTLGSRILRYFRGRGL